MECTDQDIVLRPAVVTDQKAILDITKDEDLFGGLDYLPFALGRWLEEAEDENSNRKNFVFLIKEKIIGFNSLYFQNSGKVAVKFAWRISPTIRGKGYGKHFTRIFGKYLIEMYPNLEEIISVIPDNDLTDDEIKSSKHGDLLLVKSVLNYKLKLEQVKVVAIKEDNFRTVNKEEFSQILRNKLLTEELLKNNLVHMNWVPVLLETEEDINFAVRKNQVVFVESLKETVRSFSIFTRPYSVSNDNTRAAIDIFAKDNEAVETHVIQQIKNFATNKNEKGALEGEMFLSIIVAEVNVEAVVQAMEILGLQKFKYVYGSQNRDLAKMYFYQKHV